MWSYQGQGLMRVQFLNSNVTYTPAVTMATYFAKMDPKFPKVDEGNIPVVHFLNATKQLIPFIEMLGSAFQVVTRDIQGNITKLQRVYDFDPVKLSDIRAMLLNDIEKKNTKNSSSATIALLWLGRTLHFLVIMLQLVVKDHQESVFSENITPFCKQAYEESLKKYHGWITQKIFGVCIKAVPHRRVLLDKVSFGREDLHDEAIQDIHLDLGRMEENIEAIQQLYTHLGISQDDKV